MFVQTLVLTLFLFFGSCLGENCDHLGVLLYEDIGCTPEKVDGKACPVQFKCDDLQNQNNTCLFQGKTLKPGEAIDNNITYSSCRVGCRCNPHGSFTCAILDCPEWMGVHVPPNCYRTYTPGKCCSTGKICRKGLNGPYDHDLAKCVVDGREYKEGDRFSPPDSCMQCVCQEGFDGKFVEPFCKRKICSEQIRDSDKLAQNCAPFYPEGNTLCCPAAYVCPKDSDEIKQISPKPADSQLKCKFGKQEAQIGQGIETKIEYWGKTKEVRCECILPPFLTCKEINIPEPTTVSPDLKPLLIRKIIP